MRYYAALALRKIRSPHLSGGSRAAAAEVIREVDSTPAGERKYFESEEIESARLTAP